MRPNVVFGFVSASCVAVWAHIFSAASRRSIAGNSATMSVLHMLEQ